MADIRDQAVQYNNLRFYFCFHTRMFGEVKLSSSWPSVKTTMTSSLRTEKEKQDLPRRHHWFFI